MKMNNEVKLIVGIVAVCVLLMGAFVWLAPQPGASVARDLTLLVRDDSYMTGKIGSKVTLVEFGDYQCPACATVAPFVKEIVDLYKNNPDFNFVYRHFPLSQHANAIISSEAAEAAGAQGKFWEMSELLYKNQREWENVSKPLDLFVGYANSLGLDPIKFRTDIEKNTFLSLVKSDLQDAQGLALDHTPFLFLNGVEVDDLASLKAQIDVALAI